MNRVIGWALVAFAVYFVFNHPGPAANDIHALAGFIGHVANTLSTLAMKL